MRVKIRLDTLTDVREFVNIVTKTKAKVVLTDGDGYRVSGRSLMGALYSIEWDNIYAESDTDIYNEIKTFVLDE